MWDVLVKDIDEVADKTRFTQLEKDFVVEFMANTLHGLTMNNVQSRQEEKTFIRMCDAREVLDNLDRLYDKHKDDDYGENAEWTFTLQRLERLCVVMTLNIESVLQNNLKRLALTSGEAN